MSGIGLEERVVDRYCTFKYLLSYIDQDFRETEGKCFCPFHENSDTPAAKLFRDGGGEYIHCFAEGRRYYPHHLLTKSIVPFTLNHVFSSIWNMLSSSEKAEFDIPVDYHCEVDYSELYNRYKSGEIDLSKVVEELVKQV